MINIKQCEPLISGTNIEIYRIGALIDGGMSDDDIINDYPSLNRQKILEVIEYINLYPYLQNPYPKMTLKAALKNSNLHLLDE